MVGVVNRHEPTNHKDTVATCEANGGVRRVLEKQASQQSTKKRNDIPNSLTPKEPRSADTPLSMGNPYGNATTQRHFDTHDYYRRCASACKN